MIILKRLQVSWEFWFVVFTSLLFFLLRLPSLFEPLWYGDEGIYQAIGASLDNGKLLYRDIFDNKPPLLYWLYYVFHSDQFAIRLVSLIFGVLSVIAFFFLAKKLFGNRKIYLTVTFIFAVLFGMPILEGNIANAENFMLLPIIVSAILILNAQKPNLNQSSINPSSFIINPYSISGLLLGLAFLFKVVAIFDFSAFFVFYFIINFVNFPSIKKDIKLISFILGFSLPIVIASMFFLLNGAFIDFIKATFISNISYVGYGNKIGSSPILLFVKLILLGAFTFYIFRKRDKFDKASLFILLWLAFSLFNTFFSQRGYTHYLLALLPSFSLMVGLIFFDKKYKRSIAIFFLVALIAILQVFGIPNFNKSIYYYQNFLSYISGGKSMAQYQEFFDKKTPFDYEIARFIKSNIHKDDTIFVWGNNAQLYQLVGVIPPTKYIVAYHITSYSDGVSSTKASLEKTKPRFIVAMPNQGGIPFPLINYSKKININKAIIYERIF